MKKAKLVNRLLIASLLGCMAFSLPSHATAAETSSDVFYDDFSGDSLNSDKWLVADKHWGGENGGVVPENVSVSQGTLKLEGHGNLYTGDVESYQSLMPGGIRTGAAIATREYYSSGSYEVVAKVAPQLGACSAIWTFEYEEYYPGSAEYEASGATGQYSTVNHEIDMEFPTANGTHSEPTFECGRFNTYTAENRHNSNFQDLPFAVDDGKFHTYRFDWHTGDDSEEKRVDYYIDDIFICTSTKYVPTNASRFWLGIWFPSSQDTDGDGYGDSGWAGTADFDTTIFEIDSVKITPYHESGDTVGKESFAYDGWAVDSFPELIEAEKFNHIVNGDFSQGKTSWKFSGDADVSNDAALLSSGSSTDEISQSVSVKQKMTYTLSADIETDGTAVTVGVRKSNGTCDTSETFTKSGHVDIPFVTESNVSEMEAYIQVLRYQEGNSVKIDNVMLTSGTSSGSSDRTDPDPTPDPDPDPDTDSGTDSTETASTLVVNGDFSEGESGWTTSGSTVISDGKASLASGSDTDTLSQKIAVNGNTEYVLTADVISSGAEITVGVQDYNGRYTNLSKTTSSSGKLSLSFTTASHINQIKIFAKVLRYQDAKDPVVIDNIVLKAKNSSDSTDSSVPSTNNLIKNGTFTDGSNNWTLNGSASILQGKAILSSGSDTDDIQQAVTLEANTTYRLSCDIVSEGCSVDLLVMNHDGKYSKESVSYSSSRTGYLTFTTGNNCKEAKIVLRVLRYQSTSSKVQIKNVTLLAVK